MVEGCVLLDDIDKGPGLYGSHEHLTHTSTLGRLNKISGLLLKMPYEEFEKDQRSVQVQTDDAAKKKTTMLPSRQSIRQSLEEHERKTSAALKINASVLCR